jgi:hypothetical protein
VYKDVVVFFVLLLVVVFHAVGPAATTDQLPPATRASFEIASEVVEVAGLRPTVATALAAASLASERRAIDDQFCQRAAVGRGHFHVAVHAGAHALMMQPRCDSYPSCCDDSRSEAAHLACRATRALAFLGQTFFWNTQQASDQGLENARVYGMCRPLIARATTNRWISLVPSKIV